MGVPVILLALLLIAIIVVDLRHQIIPDALNTLLAWLAVFHLAQTVPTTQWFWHAVSALLLGGMGAFFAGPYSRWRKRDMLGWGDVKFFAAAGLWLALPQIWLFLTLAGAFGVVGALLYRAKTGRAETPFAPALCMALWASVQHGDALAMWFMRLL